MELIKSLAKSNRVNRTRIKNIFEGFQRGRSDHRQGG